MLNPTRYIVITPARNEQENIGHTIRSMAAQTCRPALWVIVNDGSTDRTGDIIEEAIEEHAWIKVVNRPDRGFPSQGTGIIDAFYEGYKAIYSEAWDFLVKLDGDLSFENDYFERCLNKFTENPKLGIGGGLICKLDGSTLVAECPNDPVFHVRGATKIYRRECWQCLSGLARAPGWDAIDELVANMHGWTTSTFSEIKIRQLRYTGSVDGTWKTWTKNGRANYFTGYHPLFMLIKCLKYCVRHLDVKAGLGLFVGYFGSYIKLDTRVCNQSLIKYIRRQQMNKLTFRPSLW